MSQPKKPIVPSSPLAPPPSSGSAAEWTDVKAIHPWPKNPRKISERAVGKVAGLIKRFGFSNPILARLANGEIIGGHTRYRAALKLGMTTVPVRYLDLSERDAHKLAIADNRSGEETEWDDALLAVEIRSIRELGEDLEALAFDDDEIVDILKRAGSPPPTSEADTTLPRDPITEGAPSSDGGSGDDDAPPERRPRGNPVIQYAIIFESEEQQTRWFGFLRKLKAKYESSETVADRLDRFLDDAEDTI